MGCERKRGVGMTPDVVYRISRRMEFPLTEVKRTDCRKEGFVEEDQGLCFGRVKFEMLIQHHFMPLLSRMGKRYLAWLSVLFRITKEEIVLVKPSLNDSKTKFITTTFFCPKPWVSLSRSPNSVRII